MVVVLVVSSGGGGGDGGSISSSSSSSSSNGGGGGVGVGGVGSCHCFHHGEKCLRVNVIHLSELSTKDLRQLAIQLKIWVQKVIDLLWLFMELHMLKLMMLSIMLLCVFDVSDAAL